MTSDEIPFLSTPNDEEESSEDVSSDECPDYPHNNTPSTDSTPSIDSTDSTDSTDTSSLELEVALPSRSSFEIPRPLLSTLSHSPASSLPSIIVHRPSRFTLILGCVCIVVIFLLTGTLVFGLLEDWSFLDALYFSTSTLTTCGVGDFVPMSLASKIFMIFYVLFALVLFGSALGLMVQSALDREEELTDEPLRLHYAGYQADPSTDTTCKPMNPILRRTMLSLLILVLILLSTIAFFCFVEGWSAMDALYYAVIVASSIGLGDIAATTNGGKIFSIFLMLFGVATVATCLRSIVDLFILYRHRSSAAKVLHTRMNLDCLPLLDLNRSGNVSAKEFLEFMLIHMNLVTVDDIVRINEQFLALDKDRNGVLDIQDLRRTIDPSASQIP